MVQQAVEDRAGDHGIAEDLAPSTEALIAGDDDRTAFVTARDQLEEQVGALTVNRQVSGRKEARWLGCPGSVSPLPPAKPDVHVAAHPAFPKHRQSCDVELFIQCADDAGIVVISTGIPAHDAQLGRFHPRQEDARPAIAVALDLGLEGRLCFRRIADISCPPCTVIRRAYYEAGSTLTTGLNFGVHLRDCGRRFAPGAARDFFASRRRLVVGFSCRPLRRFLT